jgi:L-iditol 2-dehydrogenase
MRAVVYRGVNDLRVETVPVPRIKADELLVKVAVCGVCPTDIKKIQHGTVPPPRIFGHETAGTIVKVGSRVKSFHVGSRVALHHHVSCLDCHACRHRAFAQCDQYKRTGITAGFEPAGGGYAEYVRVMSFVLPGVVGIPNRNTFVEGAMLEPVNTVLKAINRLSVLPGDAVLVIGQGPIGLMFTRLLALRRAAVVASDLLASRLKLAREMGAQWVFLANEARVEEKIRRITRGRGLEAVVIAVPSDEAVRNAQQLVRGGGKVLLFAHTLRGGAATLDFSAVCVDEKDLIGSYSSDSTLQRTVARCVFSRRLDVRHLVSHWFPLEQTPEAIKLAGTPSAGSLKVVVSCDTVSAGNCRKPPGGMLSGEESGTAIRPQGSSTDR